MNWGDFRQYFRGFAWKRLTPHEVDPRVSNGHEFQGVSRLRELIGTEATERLPTTYVLLRDEEDDIETLRLWSKWYDARARNPDRAAEWRLYYPAEAGSIQSRMRAGDLMVIAVTNQGTLLILLAARGSARERQLQVLFGVEDDGLEKMRVRAFEDPVPLDFVTITILEQLGISRPIVLEESRSAVVTGLIAELHDEYPESLPPGQAIAELVRERLPGVEPREDPDEALYRWLEAEEAIYRGWEDRKIAARLRAGFNAADGEPDVDGFRRFSMSLRQSRVSRAGGALQYHFRALLELRRIRYVMEPVVDHGEIPDFIFPSKADYEDRDYPADQLRMLAAKFTAKDRWRQVLNEAHRIPDKHLLTLDAAISRNQLDLIRRARLTLVIPEAVRSRYGQTELQGIVPVRAFLEEVASLGRPR